MKKSLSIFLIFFSILRGVTAQNIYESIGKKADILTLSEGKYQEIFTNDTLVRIGSVLFNRVTNEVVEFVTKKDSNSLAEADVASRFLSVDPIGREYPELTPYQFASNTPIQAIDLDGLERLIVTGSQWNNSSDGHVEQNTNTTFDESKQELDKEGVQMTLHNLDTKQTSTIFIEPVTILSTRTKSFEKASQENITSVMEKTGILPAGRYIQEEGAKMKQAGFGLSIESRNSAFYGKFSAEKYSTNESNAGSRAKLEAGIRGDGQLRLGESGDLSQRNIFTSRNYSVERPSLEFRLYFHKSNQKPNLQDGGSSGLTWSLNSTTKIPVWGLGGVYYNHDVVGEKSEFGFYFNSDKQDFKFQTQGTVKSGVKAEINSSPR